MIKLIFVILLSLISISLSIRIIDDNIDVIDNSVKVASSSQPTIYVIGDFYSIGLTVSIYDQFTGVNTVIVNNDPAFTELSIVDTLLLTPSEVVFMTGNINMDNGSVQNCTLYHYDLQEKSTTSAFHLPIGSGSYLYLWELAEISAVNQSQFFVVSYAKDGTTKLESFNMADGSPIGFSVSLPQIALPLVTSTQAQIKIDSITQLAYVMVCGPGQQFVEENDVEGIKIEYDETALACGYWSGCCYLFTVNLTSQSVVRTLDITKFPGGIGYTLSNTILLPNGTLIGPGEPTVKSAYFEGGILTLDLFTGAYSIKALTDYQVDFISGGVFNNTLYMLVKNDEPYSTSNASRLIGYDVFQEKIVLDVPNTNIDDRHELIFI